MKINKKDLNKIVMETIHEMLQEEDEGLIKLMMESEKVYGDGVNPVIVDWIDKTVEVLQEHMGYEPEPEPIELITEERIDMLTLAGVITEGVDNDAAYELELYIDNEAKLYNRQYLPILKNLSKKVKKGKYDKKLAVKLWMYLVDEGAKMYHKEFSGVGKWNDMFNKATRLTVAQELEEKNRDGVESGEYL